MTSPSSDPAPFAEIAVPVPIHSALTYRVPAAWDRLTVPGVRARVQVGRRRLTGVVLRRISEPPKGVDLRPLGSIVDLAPILPRDLLSLAQFVADYYLEPIGEVLRGMVPTDLTAWGARRVRLTSGGAIARPREEMEERIAALLLERGKMTVAELQAELEDPQLPARLESLQEEGRLSLEETASRGQRYVSAVELPAGDLPAQLESVGRSPQGRNVVQYLADLGRPATLEEVVREVGCSKEVVRRLCQRGVLRKFTQVERISLSHHRLEGSGAAPVIVLRDDQRAATEQLAGVIQNRAFQPFLLRGMTGSGKTEVYLRAVEECLAAGRTAILLVPEIALVPALARTVRQRFGERLALLHSGLGRAEREQEWERLRGGGARVVLGPRSAIFAPLPDVGLVVVDEEQDPSYKQETTPRYNGRDLALVRAQRANAPALLVSATPSLESRHNVDRDRYRELRLVSRAGQGRLPDGILVDLRGERPSRRPGEVHFSERLRSEVSRSLEQGEQIILLRNRRGYAPLYICRACGEDMRCDDCGLPRTYHRREGRLICHYCGSTRPRPPRCPSCGEEAMEALGAGTERVEEDFKELFPEARVGVLDRDSVRRKGGAAGVLEAFGSGATQVLIGTQMVSKGHHFPGVALTAVLSADTYLGFPDFRAVERTYNLLTQLAGRAGRGDRPGRVVIQTYHPDHYAIRAALENDDRRFAEEEMRFRRTFHYPPFTRMVQLLRQDRNQDRGREGLAALAAELERHPLAAGVRILGPAPAPLEKLRGKWRFQLLLRHGSGSRLRQLVREAVLVKPQPGLTVDVDPYDLM